VLFVQIFGYTFTIYQLISGFQKVASPHPGLSKNGIRNIYIHIILGLSPSAPRVAVHQCAIPTICWLYIHGLTPYKLVCKFRVPYLSLSKNSTRNLMYLGITFRNYGVETKWTPFLFSVLVFRIEFTMSRRPFYSSFTTSKPYRNWFINKKDLIDLYNLFFLNSKDPLKRL